MCLQLVLVAVLLLLPKLLGCGLKIRFMLLVLLTLSLKAPGWLGLLPAGTAAAGAIFY